MRSISYGEVTFQGMYKLICDYMLKSKGQEFKITVGTDSQNYDITKVVIVVAVWNVGHGGIFFYDIKKVNKITNIRQKIFYETSLSLELADKLNTKFSEDSLNYEISIHVDAGDNGKSGKLISEIVSWVNSCGFACMTKPDSYAASSIANKYSK